MRTGLKWHRKDGVVLSKGGENKKCQGKVNSSNVCSIHRRGREEGEGGVSPVPPTWPLLAPPVFSQARRWLCGCFPAGSFGQDVHPLGLKFCILGT